LQLKLKLSYSCNHWLKTAVLTLAIAIPIQKVTSLIQTGLLRLNGFPQVFSWRCGLCIFSFIFDSVTFVANKGRKLSQMEQTDWFSGLGLESVEESRWVGGYTSMLIFLKIFRNLGAPYSFSNKNLTIQYI
jgi:hypothetical protein